MKIKNKVTPRPTPIERAFSKGFYQELRKRNITQLDTKTVNGKVMLDGAYLWFQKEVGGYRVDFEASFWWVKPDGSQGNKFIIIECDSQEFHERIENERRYEKARDRFFNKQGLTAFHYTGTELLQNSDTIASEVVDYITGEK